MPDISVNLALYKFQLIELINNPAPVFHKDLTSFSESVGVPKAQRCGAVARNQLFRRQRQAIDRTIRSIPQALDFTEAREYEGACWGQNSKIRSVAFRDGKAVIDG